MIGAPVDEAKVKSSEERLYKTLDIIDGILASQKYMGGDAYSLADIAYIPQLFVIHVAVDPAIFAARPNLARWWEEVTAREAFKKIIPQMDEAYRSRAQKRA